VLVRVDGHPGTGEESWVLRADWSIPTTPRSRTRPSLSAAPGASGCSTIFGSDWVLALAGLVFELHAGVDYVDHGLAQGLERSRAGVREASGFSLGQQLAFYGSRRARDSERSS